MKKNKIIIVGIVLTIIGALGIILSFPNSKSLKNYNENHTFTQSIKSIELDVDKVDVEILAYEGQNIKYEASINEGIKIDKDVVNDVLRISLKDRFRLHFNNNQKIKIYIPKNSKLDYNIDVSLGDFDASGLNVINLNVSLGAGTLHLNNIKGELIDLNNSLGEVNLLKVEATNLMVKQSSGSGSYKNINIKEDVNIINNLGDIDINEMYAYNVDIKNDLGNVTFINSTKHDFKKFNVKVSMGDKKVKLG